MTDETWATLPGVMDFTFTAEATADPELIRLLRGAEKPAKGHAVQVDYRVPVKLPRWRRAWLWVRHKSVPTIQRRLVIPNASVTVTDPTEDTP
jgi:hypothetical protein